jgi:hypothetical protein
MSRTGRNPRREHASSFAQGSAGELPPALLYRPPVLMSPPLLRTPLILTVQSSRLPAIREAHTLLPFQNHHPVWNCRSLSLPPLQGSAIPPVGSARRAAIPQSPRPLRMKLRSVGHISPGDAPQCVVAFKFALIIGRAWIHSKSSTASPRSMRNLFSFHAAAGGRRNAPPPTAA